MRIGVLGSLLVDAGDGPVPVQGARLRALVVRLALDAGRPVRPETLAADLWTEGDPAASGVDPTASGGALQSLASRLRRALGRADLVLAGPAGYRLDVDPQDVDARRFEALASDGRRALAAGRTADASELLAGALRLWRGPALADVRDAPFAPAASERLERLRLATVEDRIEADLRLGPDQARLRELVEELRTLAAGHPLDERLHGQLLRALAADGRVPEALAHFAQVRRVLADELGTDPSPQLRDLHAALLRAPGPRDRRAPSHAPSTPAAPAAPSAPAPESAPAAAAPAPARGNLPAPVSSFVGREADLARVSGLLGEHRLVTLVGPGGAGKTRLATEVGRLESAPAGRHGFEGAWLVALAPVTAADDVPRAVLDALDLRESALIAPAGERRPGDVPDRLVDLLAGRHLLLLLDNCEHVVDAAAAIAEHLLERCPGLHLLATSREPLRVPGEQLHPVLPLGLPAEGDGAARVGDSAAVRLFLDRATAARPGLTLDDRNAAAAVEICRRLDGLPLAIELAAARLRTLPIEVVAARLDDRFRLLTQGMRTALPRHQTLRAVVDWSWDLLDDAERALLERLAALPGGFTEEVAASAHPDCADLLAALVDKSLLQLAGPQGDGPRAGRPAADRAPGDLPAGQVRYRMLETIREYGLERLAARGETAAVRERFTGYYLALAEAADPGLRGPDQLVHLAALNAEHANLLASLRWAADAGDAATAVRMAAALSWYWTVRGSFEESRDWIEVALGVPGEVPPTPLAVALTMYALSAMASGRVPDADQWRRIRAAIDGSDPAASPPLLVLAVPASALLSGDRTGGLDFIDRFSDHPDPWTRAALHLMEGVMAENSGEIPRALAALPKALEGFRALGDHWGMATSLTSLGELLPQSGRVDEGIAALEEAVVHSVALGASDDAAQLGLRLVQVQLRLGDVEGARERIQALLRPGAAPASTYQVAGAKIALAELELGEGRIDEARSLALSALATIETELSNPPPQVPSLTLATLARIDAAGGRPEEAAAWLRRPETSSVLLWDMPVSARVAVAAAAVRLAAGAPEEAAELLGVAVALRGGEDHSDAVAVQVQDGVTSVVGPERFEAARRRGATLPRDTARTRLATVLGLPDGEYLPQGRW